MRRADGGAACAMCMAGTPRRLISWQGTQPMLRQYEMCVTSGNSLTERVCACACVRVRVCVLACLRACVRACLRGAWRVRVRVRVRGTQPAGI